jgi:glc operon protein GlcG
MRVLKMTGPLDLDTAQVLQNRVVARARAAGLKMAVHITDDHGESICSARMDGTKLDSIRVAFQKASTAARKHCDTREITTTKGYDLADLLAASAANPDFQHWGGGVVLVNEDGVVLGGLGVSGGTPEQDHVLAADEDLPAAA